MLHERATITLNDVAQRAGVSPMTVSNVINGKGNVRPATRQRVLTAIAETGYRVNPLARSLAGGHNRIISVFTPQLNRPYAAEVVQGAGEAAERLNYDLVVMMLSPNSTSDFSMMARLSVGALLIQPSRQTQQFSTDLPTHVVSVDGPSAHPLVVDNYGGACLAMNHLLSLGHTEIGFISGLEAEPDVKDVPQGSDLYERNDAHERFRGYRESLALAGLPQNAAYVQHGNFTKESGEQAAQALLRLPVPPTALFVSGDAMALGALHAAQDFGLRVPGELSVVGFDDLPMATASRPGLTTVRQPLLHMGAVAVQMLAALAAGEEPLLPAPFPTQLIVRESTARR
ncbi:LacI family transcriptional regulator (plasmid) [Deinococcus sp. KNUC1210]|uniref:LacI family DNA-binding transcriptional regulator n=1 Tax=Deinococcus sp. KNUC1210 TaxID=2917691 RepID=UPI001EF12207|nr:LacI family DNA-binding transcriptional regulator [Deinococcus sp. KNUC1210]ULH17009.1 LacI family transcriptional regulator [Deinococcus sp. KNUC1210]